MRPHRYLIAIRTVEFSEDEEIKYAVPDIESYVDDLHKERAYLCSRVATLTRQRDQHRKEINDLKEPQDEK